MITAAIEFWHWWALGVLLGTIEALAPGFVFGWFGVAAGLTGGLLLLLPGLDPLLQLTAFALFAVASLLPWFVLVRRPAGAEPADRLNIGAAQHIGRRCTVVEPIENGRGRIRVGDSSWVAVGRDAPAGARVVVVGVDGTALVVEPEPPEPGDRAA